MFDDEYAALQVVQLLHTPAVRRIDLTLRGITVARARFDRVAQAIGAGRIRVWRLPTSHMAAYADEGNSLAVPESFGGHTWRASRLEDEALVVHEAVHASFDLDRRTIDAGQEEAIAYVAQMAFLHLNDHAPALAAGPPGSAQRAIGQVLNEAYAIAVTLLEHGTPSEMTVATLENHVRRISVPDPDAPPDHPRDHCPYAGGSRVYQGV